MKKLIQNQKLITLWKTIRPWAGFILVILILRYTGLMSSISYFSTTALMKTGFMDAGTGSTSIAQKFNYDFIIKDLNGNKIDVNKFRGKVIFLNMWATWCGPCRAEMPSIQELYNKVNHDSIIFIMLSLDTDEHHQKVVQYVANKEFTFPVYQPSGYLPEQLQVPSIPTTFVIARDGKIKSKNIGTANYNTEKFKGFLEGLLVH
jgi:thiol-disulfide isomerase/thioredoxin